LAVFFLGSEIFLSEFAFVDGVVRPENPTGEVSSFELNLKSLTILIFDKLFYFFSSSGASGMASNTDPEALWREE
jgi:type IV secretory pathway VirB6-like protein